MKEWFIVLMETFTVRLSNVLAWFGFSFIVINYIAGFMRLEFITDTWIQSPSGYISDAEFGVMWLVYIGCAAVNYLMSGRMRLLPWRGVRPSDTEEE